MIKKIRIIHLEDSPSDAELIGLVIKKSGFQFEKLNVDTKEKFIAAIESFQPDVILADHSLPSFNSMEALTIYKEFGMKIPFILVTATMSEEFAVEILREGAADYILKDRPGRLPNAILKALEKSRFQEERQQFLDQLVNNERKFRSLIENCADAILIFNSEYQPSYVSPSVSRILGYSESEILEANFKDLLHPEDKEKLFLKFTASLKNPGMPTNGELYRIRHQDGSWRWIESVLTNMLHDLAVNGIVNNFRDVTEKKSAEEEVRFQANLLNTIGQAVIATDMDGRVNYWNKAAEEIYGWTKEEAIGKFILDLTPTSSSKEEAIEIMEALFKGKSWQGEFNVKRKDGFEFPVFVSNSPIYDNQNKLSGIIGISSDITQRREFEESLKSLNQTLDLRARELALSNAELEQFAYVASHDLQEPLRMVSSFLLQLEKKYGDNLDQKAKQYISFAVDGSKRMRQIILDILEFSRLGRDQEEKTMICLNDLMDEICFLQRETITEKSATIKVENLPTLYYHKSPLIQVFHNLINNALKYSKSDLPPVITISATEFEEDWNIKVSDNGIGIDEKYFDKIFIIFQRLYGREAYEGTGMGLSIVKKIVENIGGKIWVESEIGEGSTFYFSLPKAAGNLNCVKQNITLIKKKD